MIRIVMLYFVKNPCFLKSKKNIFTATTHRTKTPHSPPPLVLLAAQGRQPANELNGVHIVSNDHLQKTPRAS